MKSHVKSQQKLAREDAALEISCNDYDNYNISGHFVADNMLLSSVPWRVVVIDEAHRLKNRNCKLLEGLNNLQMVRKLHCVCIYVGEILSVYLVYVCSYKKVKSFYSIGL